MLIVAPNINSLLLAVFYLCRKLLENSTIWCLETFSRKNLPISFVIGGLSTSSTGIGRECFLGVNMANPCVVPTSVLYRGCWTLFLLQLNWTKLSTEAEVALGKDLSSKVIFLTELWSLKKTGNFCLFYVHYNQSVGKPFADWFIQICLNGAFQTRKHC